MSGERVTTEFLRMQVADRVPGAIGICARSLGVEPLELIDMAERGDLTTEHLLPVMTDDLRELLTGV